MNPEEWRDPAVFEDGEIRPMYRPGQEPEIEYKILDTAKAARLKTEIAGLIEDGYKYRDVKAKLQELLR